MENKKWVPEIDLNNVSVEYHGWKISIADHKDLSKSKGHPRYVVREVAIWHLDEESPHSKILIVGSFGQDLSGLTGALDRAKNYIDHVNGWEKSWEDAQEA